MEKHEANGYLNLCSTAFRFNTAWVGMCTEPMAYFACGTLKEGIEIIISSCQRIGWGRGGQMVAHGSADFRGERFIGSVHTYPEY